MAVALAALLVSCETVSYYTQAARGQMEILLGRENIEKLLKEDNLAPDLRAKFLAVISIRDFAQDELYLPVADNYLTYVDLEREHVVWNVFAAPEFSVDPVNWCYPIAGCVSYRGYFSETQAQRFAQQLSADNFDVYTGGVDAYSTLGWFNDSLLSTVSSRTDYQLASLIFHELAHQVIYIPGDTTFNESFATTVEREGLKRWLENAGQAAVFVQAETDGERQEQFVQLVLDYRDQFDALYQEEMAASLKRQRKLALQEQLRADYVNLKEQWQGYGGYDAWFANSLNNAQLSTVSSYNEFVPFFTSELNRVDGDFQRFYSEMKQFTQMDADARAQRLVEFSRSDEP